MQIDNSKPLIITKNSLGGSVATLFTLSLLEKFKISTTKCPLCITFGSPLIGDKGLQEAISNYPTWNSCFLHVVSNKDPVPRVLINGYTHFSCVWSWIVLVLKTSKPFWNCWWQPIQGVLKIKILIRFLSTMEHFWSISTGRYFARILPIMSH